jgi:hypothetical protein
VLAQVRLIHKSTSKRYVAQGLAGLKHELSRQLDSTPDYIDVGGVTECAPEGARKMGFAEIQEPGEVSDK